MAPFNRNNANKDWAGFSFLPILVTILFVFAFWQTSSIGFSFRSLAKVDALVIEELEQRAAGSASIIEILIWILFASIGILLHIVNKEHAIKTWAKAWPLLLLLVFILLSISWSAVPDIAIRRVAKQLMLVLILAGIVVAASSPREILRLAIVFTGLLMAVNCSTLVLFPNAALDNAGAFQGLFGHRNSAGEFAMITVFIWFSAARWTQGARMRCILILGTLLWFVFLLGTDSRTAIGTTILAIMVIVPLRFLVRDLKLAAVCVLGVVFFAAIAWYVVLLFGITFSDIVALIDSQRATLSGRFTIWQFMYKVIQSHIILGAGFGSVWSTSDVGLAEIYGEEALLRLTQAHNGYLDVLAALGLVGAIIFLVFLVSAFVTVISAFKPANLHRFGAPLVEICSFIFVANVVANLTKTTFLLDNRVAWSSFLFCYLVLCSARVTKYSEDIATATSIAATESISNERVMRHV